MLRVRVQALVLPEQGLVRELLPVQARVLVQPEPEPERGLARVPWLDRLLARERVLREPSQVRLVQVLARVVP